MDICFNFLEISMLNHICIGQYQLHRVKRAHTSVHSRHLIKWKKVTQFDKDFLHRKAWILFHCPIRNIEYLNLNSAPVKNSPVNCFPDFVWSLNSNLVTDPAQSCYFSWHLVQQPNLPNDLIEPNQRPCFSIEFGRKWSTIANIRRKFKEFKKKTKIFYLYWFIDHRFIALMCLTSRFQLRLEFAMQIQSSESTSNRLHNAQSTSNVIQISC